MKTIILIGYMGSGKSSVGKKLATTLQLPLLDTDSLIVEQEKMSINDIFSTKGEEYFRDLETKLLKNFLEENKTDVILSTGGGMPMRDENADIMKALGTVIYLKAKPDTIYQRVRYDNSRPLLKCADPLAKIKEMLDIRNPKYTKAATHIVDVDGKSIKNIVDEICDRVKE